MKKNTVIKLVLVTSLVCQLIMANPEPDKECVDTSKCVPTAIGNQASCPAQGFFCLNGSCGGDDAVCRLNVSANCEEKECKECEINEGTLLGYNCVGDCTLSFYNSCSCGCAEGSGTETGRGDVCF